MSHRARLTLTVLLAALSLACTHAPLWTDYNESDPGITFATS